MTTLTHFRVRSSVLVLFPDDWAPYSPSLTRLVEHLSESFSVNVVALDTGRCDFRGLSSEIYHRATVSPRWAIILRKMALLRLVRTLLLAWHAKRLAPEAAHVIAVDADGVIASCLLRVPMHFMSLEVSRLSLVRWLVPRFGRSILIQSKERLNYQFPRNSIEHLPVFFVQNAPDLASFPPAILRPGHCTHPRLIFMGNAIRQHGLLQMLELMRRWPEATLTLQGMVPAASREMIQRQYQELLDNNRVCIRSDYVPDADIAKLLSEFDIGLCLYEPGPTGQLNFNYRSAPAGKMFNYFAAGLPVIASDLIGLRPVSQFRAGIQCASNNADVLLQAGLEICRNYQSYQSGARAAAEYFDFSRAVEPYVDFLRNQS